jgi:hypothetical protein
MRLWTIHPRYLDPQGLVALWREALLARTVLRGQTRGYRYHPQLQRFQLHAVPRSAINAYLAAIFLEAESRGYAFDRSKIGPVRARIQIHVSVGQLGYEWRHLLGKLKDRNPACYRQWCGLATPDPHPIFCIGPGGVEPWERQ